MIAFEQTGSLKFSLHPWLDFARKIAGWCFITFQRRGENCQTWGYESQKVFLRQACIPFSSWTLPSSSPPSTGGTKWSCHRGLYFFQLSQSMFSLVSFTLIIKRGGGSLSWSTLRNVSSHQLPTPEKLQLCKFSLILRRGGRPLVVDAKWLQRKKRILQMKSERNTFF